ncbi:hypothetical protein GCM10010468_69960 [Actinocorallia longicatena]|uniref:Uncharacterized protein n=1 Tax=Actinocorallia longicatena TaxID=111803 RepID=A0ABP6QJM9_9ACTN
MQALYLAAGSVFEAKESLGNFYVSGAEPCRQELCALFATAHFPFPLSHLTELRAVRRRASAGWTRRGRKTFRRRGASHGYGDQGERGGQGWG